jgi:hypothetical protein
MEAGGWVSVWILGPEYSTYIRVSEIYRERKKSWLLESV